MVNNRRLRFSWLTVKAVCHKHSSAAVNKVTFTVSAQIVMQSLELWLLADLQLQDYIRRVGVMSLQQEHIVTAVATAHDHNV